MFLDGESNEKIKRYTELSDEEIASVRKFGDLEISTKAIGDLEKAKKYINKAYEKN